MGQKLDALPYVPAYWQQAGRAAALRLIVLHAMQAPEYLGTGESTANYFKNGCPDAHGVKRKASAHLVTDTDSAICCVRAANTAYGAPGANANGFHVEHAGYSDQAGPEWLDAYGVPMLTRSAELVAEVCDEFNIPSVYLDADALRAAGKEATGITTHLATTIAYKVPGGHTDPGTGFPIDWYVDHVKHFRGESPQPPGPPPRRVTDMITIVTDGPTKSWWVSVNGASGYPLRDTSDLQLLLDCDLGQSITNERKAGVDPKTAESIVVKVVSTDHLKQLTGQPR